MTKKVCSICGKEYEFVPHTGGHVIFCNACVKRVLDQLNKHEEIVKNGGMFTHCVVCGKPIKNPNPQRKACSSRCGETIGKIRRTEYGRQHPRKSTQTKKKPIKNDLKDNSMLDEKSRAANKMGLSYGEYVALMRR